MSVFENLLSVADAVVDGTMAETFSFTPMRDVRNGTPVADDTRSAIAEVQGVFDDRGLLLTLAQPGLADRQSSSPMISIRTVLLPEGARRLDRFVRLNTGQAYEVRAADPDGLGRIVFTVVEAAP